jgi:hypothetical protein
LEKQQLRPGAPAFLTASQGLITLPLGPMTTVDRMVPIFFLRGHKVMLSTHLAELYEVEPRALVQAVKRNIERFPPDFIFQLTKVEFQNLKSQIVTSNWDDLRRAAPYAFTEQG